MQELWTELNSLLVGYVPQILGALAILVVGWLIALAIGGGVRGALNRSGLAERIGKSINKEDPNKNMDVGKTAGKATYLVLMLFVVIAAFQALGLTLVTEPINSLLTQLFDYAPKILAAGILLAAAWVVATILRLLVTRVLGSVKLDDKLAKNAGVSDATSVPISKTLGDAVYYLVFFLFLPAVLGALSMQGLLEPVQSMMDQFLSFLPNILGAAVIFVLGWFIARIVRQVVTSLLVAVGADQLMERLGLKKVFGDIQLSGIIGMVVYAMIIIPIAISSLSALKLDAVTNPASNMLNMIWSSFPSIFAALLVLGFSLIIGRAVAAFVVNFLSRVGFNNIAVKLRLTNETGGLVPAEIVGNLVLIGIMIFALTEAFHLLGFAALSAMFVQVLEIGGRIVFGLVIFGAGLFLANLIADTVRKSGATQSKVLATMARVTILILVGAISLRQMGLADEIINLAFGLLLGAAAVAFAIAFGIGGRQFAAEQIEKWKRVV